MLCPWAATRLSRHPGPPAGPQPVLLLTTQAPTATVRRSQQKGCDFKLSAVLLASRYLPLGVLIFSFSKVKCSISFSVFQIIKTSEKLSVKDG